MDQEQAHSSARASGGDTGDGRVELAVDISPWTRSLCFRDGATESSFINSVQACWTRYTIQLCWLILLIAPVKILTSRPRSTVDAFTFTCALAFYWIVAPFIFLVPAVGFPAFFKKHRFKILLVGRPAVVLGCSFVVFMDDVWNDGRPFPLLMRMISHAPLMCIFLEAVGARLPFKEHLIVQPLASLLSSVWIVDLCSVSESDESVRGGVNSLGYITETVLSRLAVLGFRIKMPELERGDYACWEVGAFYHVWVGVFIPSLVVYIVECLSRVNYLESARKGYGPYMETLRFFKQSTFVFAAVSFVVGTEIWWHALRILRKFIVMLNEGAMCCGAPTMPYHIGVGDHDQ